MPHGSEDAAVGVVGDDDLVARRKRSDRITALTPVVVLSTKTRSSASAPTNAAISAAAWRISVGTAARGPVNVQRSRSMNLDGCRSMRSRQPLLRLQHRRGTTPTVP